MTMLPRLADIMTRDLLTFAPETEILQAIEILTASGVSGAPVVATDGTVVGMLSQKDGLRAILQAGYHQDWSGAVADFMCKEVEGLPAELDLISAAERFLARPYRRFPVFEDTRLVGIVSRSDVLRELAIAWGHGPAPPDSGRK